MELATLIIYLFFWFHTQSWEQGWGNISSCHYSKLPTQVIVLPRGGKNPWLEETGCIWKKKRKIRKEVRRNQPIKRSILGGFLDEKPCASLISPCFPSHQSHERKRTLLSPCLAGERPRNVQSLGSVVLISHVSLPGDLTSLFKMFLRKLFSEFQNTLFHL